MVTASQSEDQNTHFDSLAPENQIEMIRTELKNQMKLMHLALSD